VSWFNRKKKEIKPPVADLRIKFKDIDGGIDVIDINLEGCLTIPFIPCIGTTFKNKNVLWKIEEIFVDYDSYMTGYHEVVVVKMSKIGDDHAI
jgi:hypothetical protein